MPELPEVECVRRSLQRRMVGRRVTAVRVTRPSVITGQKTPGSLLVGDRVDRVLRHGKQLAIVGSKGGCVSVHLGMSGQLCVLAWPDDPGNRPTGIKRSQPPASSIQTPKLPPHTHVLWQFDAGLALRFTDPRRFGGLWTFTQLEQLESERWSKLGPDALLIGPAALHNRLSNTRRCLKAALLDQQLIAGLGNIYVDELLFAARIHPLAPANTVERSEARSLVRRMRTLLNASIQHGGSSLRDYVDADNLPGSQQNNHRVYGRAGLRCLRRACGAAIVAEQVAGRTTAWCPRCQLVA